MKSQGAAKNEANNVAQAKTVSEKPVEKIDFSKEFKGYNYVGWNNPKYYQKVRVLSMSRLPSKAIMIYPVV